MEKTIIGTGMAVATTFLVFLGLLVHEIGAFCDEISDPYRCDLKE